jgi:hypothetical protein
MGINIPKTVFCTPNPERGISESYTVYADVVANANDSKKCWVVKEKHGWFDEQSRTFLNDVVTLGLTGPIHCVALDEAHRIVDQQVLSRAKSGFKYLFVLDQFGAPWYKRYEILPDGTPQGMP